MNRILCDFDGTITELDTTDVLLDRLAPSSEWRAIETAWERAEIGSGECMQRQIALIRGGWSAVADVLTGIRLDPTFKEFVRWARRRGDKVIVASEGLDRVIVHLLTREEITVDAIVANHLVECEDGSLRLELHSDSKPPHCLAGNCKCAIARRQPGGERCLTIVVGDGRSDACWSGAADLVFAKNLLLRHCMDAGIPCAPFARFSDIRSSLELTAPPTLRPLTNVSPAPKQ